VIAILGFTSSAHATFPGRTGLIAFAGTTGGAHQIYTVRPNGHGLRQVTHLHADLGYPAWSPNGRRIVFDLDRPGGPPGGTIRVMNADGTHMVDLNAGKNPPAGVEEGIPSFTPDGSRIVFQRHDPTTNDDAIWSMNLQGTDRHRITAGIGYGATAPEVSPNGTMLAFVGGNGQDLSGALFTCRMDGSNLRRLTPFSFNLTAKVNWSPDGRHLAFTVDDGHPGNTSANIATIAADGTGLRYLTHYTGGQVNAISAAYSPDGKWIAFRLEDHGRYALYRMRPDGSEPHALLPLSPLKPQQIDWGPVSDH
jgi:Tol biopolymer transport system component